jgi:hypothetical protein
LHPVQRSAPRAVLLAFPVGMAMATGTEAPSSAIAHLGPLDDPNRAMFGRITLWLTLLIVGALTLGLAAAAVRWHVTVWPRDSTQMATIAAEAIGHGTLWAMFQITSALLLLSAANSGLHAGSGLLHSLSRPHRSGAAIVPPLFGRVNTHHAPFWGVVLFGSAAVVLVIGSGGSAQVLVLYYAVAVFVSFLFGLAAMAFLAWRRGAHWAAGVAVLGMALCLLTLAADVARIYPLVPLAASGAIGGLLYAGWVRARRTADLVAPR